MSFTYDTDTDVGKVRLLIDDKVEATAHFTDEEIETFLSLAGDSVLLAAALALEAWATSLSETAESEKIGDYSYTNKLVEKKLALAKQYRELEATSPVFDIASMDLVTTPETEESEETE